ncbi:MAG: potassium channel protein [Candidatus Hinthialibacter antarcticus]|nr:potassium channel protein [Candidatus Hinthialibacter antarcticus]
MSASLNNNHFIWGRRLIDGVGILLVVFLVGVLGFKYFGTPEDSWVESWFMASITLTTVGFGEVTHLETSAAQIFTGLYAISGMGVLLFVVTTGTAFIVEGEAKQFFWQRRIKKMMEKIIDHDIICGMGRQGRVIADEYFKTKRPFVMVEADPDKIDELREAYPNTPVIDGDASDNDILDAAGIHKAHGLIACLTDDRDNLLLVVTAKQINPNIRIVCKVLNVQHLSKLNRAGADSVVSPTLIGGLRMASEMIRPTVVTFLDKMLRDKDRTLRVEEVPIPKGTQAQGKTLEQLDVNRNAGMVVVAIKLPNSEQFHYAPTLDTKIEDGMTLVVVGDVNNLPKAAALVA